MREFARSKDGTSIPVNIVRRKGLVLDGANPVLLNGYGGYDINLTPRIPRRQDTAVARRRRNFRHRESARRRRIRRELAQPGALTHKQNVFDDFIAAAEHC